MQDKRIYTINATKLDMAYIEGMEKADKKLVSVPSEKGEVSVQGETLTQ
jgi:hypothetical protein